MNIFLYFSTFYSLSTVEYSLLFLLIGLVIAAECLNTAFEQLCNFMTGDYSKYIKLPDQNGINIFKGIFSPILVLFSSDGLSLLMLSIFILVIAISAYFGKSYHSVVAG